MHSGGNRGERRKGKENTRDKNKRKTSEKKE